MHSESNQFDYSDSIKKLRQVIFNKKNFSFLLQYELDLTIKSDLKGFIDKESFKEVSNELLGGNFTLKEIE